MSDASLIPFFPICKEAFRPEFQTWSQTAFLYQTPLLSEMWFAKNLWAAWYKTDPDFIIKSRAAISGLREEKQKNQTNNPTHKTPHSVCRSLSCFW